MEAAETMTMIYVARVLAGFFAASIGTAQAVVTDVTPPSERGDLLGARRDGWLPADTELRLPRAFTLRGTVPAGAPGGWVVVRRGGSRDVGCLRR